ncbi:N-ATPase subunit AtpR [Kaarinaea lacus]
MLTTIVELLLCGLFGALLGLVFFGGLWLTVRRLEQLRQPALWVSLSLLLRMAVTVFGFYWIFSGELTRLAFAMVGFLLSRRWLRKRIASRTNDAAGHSNQVDVSS